MRLSPATPATPAAMPVGLWGTPRRSSISGTAPFTKPPCWPGPSCAPSTIVRGRSGHDAVIILRVTRRFHQPLTAAVGATAEIGIAQRALWSHLMSGFAWDVQSLNAPGSYSFRQVESHRSRGLRGMRCARRAGRRPYRRSAEMPFRSCRAAVQRAGIRRLPQRTAGGRPPQDLFRT